MLLLRFICPFIYSMIVGSAWSLWFRKNLSSSLAPAYMVHILIVLLSGLMFKRLSIGFYGGIVIALMALLVYFFKMKKSHDLSLSEIGKWLLRLWNEGGFLFTVVYIFIYLINFKKAFISWDEFSHWGMFIKESIRLDALYCMSPLEFAHKDYVPAITLFETIWCKLNFRYSEPDVYRGLQVFMFSMLLPMCEYFNLYNLNTYISKDDRLNNSVIRSRLLQLCSVSIVLLIPLIFCTSNGFYFYHSIYCDLTVGIIFYWCVFEVYRKHNDYYSFIVLTIGTSVLVLSKMTAMALMPLIIGFFLLYFILFSGKKGKCTRYVLFIPTLSIPVALWMWFNSFVRKYLGNLTGGQNYGGVRISSVKEVFTNPKNSTIPYLKTVKDAYIDAIIHRDVLIHGSYVVVVLFIVIAFFLMAMNSKKESVKKAIMITGIWILGSGIYYALLMFFLYATAFVEHEAINLASYERYMNSFIIAAIFLLIAVFYDSEIWKVNIKWIYLILILLSIDLAFLHVDVFDQVLPGIITHDEEKNSAYTDSASLILNTTFDNNSIYILKRGDNGNFLFHEQYYCAPRTIGGGSIGPKVNESDIWSKDIDVDEFVKALKDYDYIYFLDLDEDFLAKYSDAFEDPAQLEYGKIYKIIDVGSKVKLSQ